MHVCKYINFTMKAFSLKKSFVYKLLQALVDKEANSLLVFVVNNGILIIILFLLIMAYSTQISFMRS